VYGLSPEDYDTMLAQQGGVCAICQQDNGGRHLVIDHDHTTDKVRVLLCDGCNIALGGLKDNPDTARKAADYLENFK